MKKILLTVIVLPVFVLSGCIGEEAPEAYLDIVAVDKEFPAAGGAGEVVISTSGAEISAVSDRSWLTVDGADAASVRFTVGQSNEEFSRTANITISADGVSQVVNIVQMGAILSVGDEPLEMDAGGGEIAIECYSNIAEIKVEIDQDWLSYTVENSTVVLSAGPNLEGEDLTATVSVGGTWKDPVRITVTQPMVTIFEQRTLAFSRDEDAVELQKTEFYDEMEQGLTVSASDEWITYNMETSTVSVTENTSGAARSGSISFINADGKTVQTITVSQLMYCYSYFLGDWKFRYSTADGGSVIEEDVVLEENADGTGYVMSGLEYDIELGYDEEAGKLTMVFQYVGMSGDRYVFVCARTSGGTYSWTEGYGLDLIFSMSEDAPELEAVDNGAWTAAEDPVTGFGFYAFADNPPAGSGGYIVRYQFVLGMTR